MWEVNESINQVSGLEKALKEQKRLPLLNEIILARHLAVCIESGLHKDEVPSPHYYLENRVIYFKNNRKWNYLEKFSTDWQVKTNNL